MRGIVRGMVLGLLQPRGRGERLCFSWCGGESELCEVGEEEEVGGGVVAVEWEWDLVATVSIPALVWNRDILLTTLFHM